jgi:hypothetical protein
MFAPNLGELSLVVANTVATMAKLYKILLYISIGKNKFLRKIVRPESCFSLHSVFSRQRCRKVTEVYKSF